MESTLRDVPSSSSLGSIGSDRESQRTDVDHLRAVKSQLMQVQRGRNLLSQSKTAATPSQTPKRRKSDHHRNGGNMLSAAPSTAPLQPYIRSPLHSAGSSTDEVVAGRPSPEPIDLRHSKQTPTSLVKGKSVDTLQSPKSPILTSRIHRKFSSFDSVDVDDEEEHSPNPKYRKMTHSPRMRRREHIVEPAPPFFRRHSGSVSIQKRRTLKDRTRSFHQTTTATAQHPKPRHSLPPQQTKLRHSAVSAVNLRRHDLRTPSRRTAVKRRSFHFVPKTTV